MKKKQVTIAVVDDHPTMRELTRFRLERLGYKVVLEAENGRIFLDTLATAATPDICLLDINMPVMNGFETAALLKQHWPGIKVVFYSMQEGSAYKQKATQIGVEGYVMKDASSKVLESVLFDLHQAEVLEPAMPV